MMCIEEDFEIFGDYNTYAARNLMITFELCDSKERTCKSDAEIARVLAFSYILVIENEEVYQHHKEPGTGEMIIRSTKSEWYPLSTITRTDHLKKIQLQELNYNYRNVGLGLNSETDRILDSKDMYIRQLPYLNKM